MEKQTKQPVPWATLSRRHFLRLAGGASVALLIGCRPRSAPDPVAGVVEDAGSIAPTAAPTVAPTLVPQPRQIEITPTAGFYIQHFQGVENVDEASWQLQIDGLVDRPVTLDMNQVRSRPRAEMMRTLECIGNPVGGNQIGNARWAGFWLADLLAEVGVQSRATRARFEAADGYATAVDLEWILQPETLMAYEMNGEPLTAAHGFPLRILMPGLYGQKMPKWIRRIEFIDDENFQGYWERKGWSQVASVKTNSQIMTPQHISRVPLAELEVFGVAYAGNRAITGVEVGVESAGNIDWQQAEIVHGPSSQVWTQFYYRWSPPDAGSYTLYVRASDDAGFTQSEFSRRILEGSYPDGTDKIHSIVLKVG